MVRGNSQEGRRRRRHGHDGPPPTPGPTATPAIKKTVSIFGVILPGATRDPTPDIARADAVWAGCGVKVNNGGGQSWQTDALDQLSPTGVLNEFSNPSSPTTEEAALLAHQPGGAGVIHAYFVPGMSAGSRGEAFRPAVSTVSALVISDSAASDTLAHELGHILLDDGSHHSDPDNLMASGKIRHVGVDKLDATQCAKI